MGQQISYILLLTHTHTSGGAGRGGVGGSAAFSETLVKIKGQLLLNAALMAVNGLLY